MLTSEHQPPQTALVDKLHPPGSAVAEVATSRSPEIILSVIPADTGHKALMPGVKRPTESTRTRMFERFTRGRVQLSQVEQTKNVMHSTTVVHSVQERGNGRSIIAVATKAAVSL